MVSASAASVADYGSRPSWEPVRPRFRPTRLVIMWALTAASLLIAAAIVPGVSIPGIAAALIVAAIVGVLNAVVPPIVAALRLPLTVVVDFLLLLVIDATILLGAASVTD